jgi:hypothetical protein
MYMPMAILTTVANNPKTPFIDGSATAIAP